LGLERLRVKIRVLVDRGSFQAFGNDGRVAISTGVLPDGKDKSIKAVSQGTVKLVSLEVSELKSVWER
jgi:fructan beta-fructosidase